MNNQAKRPNDQGELTAEEVVAYLRAHPDFFVEHEYLLGEIKLPHRSGSAISLVERQVTLFREQRDKYEKQLYDLIETARHNDRFFDKSKRLLMNLLEAQSLDEMVIVLEDSFLTDFNVDFCSLILFGNKERFPVSNIVMQDLASSQEVLGDLLDGGRAHCGRLSDDKKSMLFGGDAKDVASAAVIPLQYGETLGVLSIGSRKADYFQSSMGSLFLSYISDSLSRMLPPLLAKEGTAGAS
ncbi:DUF484 family protein [Hahella ganghwensis]|uniref:DUF484 family protein n=1 Tax=Hahella ganghwensis TaxID=286420 RepID=UPI000379C40E|nr:DUF484 family protein [Hahella ganghwensis]